MGQGQQPRGVKGPRKTRTDLCSALTTPSANRGEDVEVEEPLRGAAGSGEPCNISSGMGCQTSKNFWKLQHTSPRYSAKHKPRQSGQAHRCSGDREYGAFEGRKKPENPRSWGEGGKGSRPGLEVAGGLKNPLGSLMGPNFRCVLAGQAGPSCRLVGTAVSIGP